MAKRESRRERARGSGVSWTSALLALVAFCVVGFALGVGFGFFVQDPELIVRHGRGESEEIAWAIDAVPESQGIDAPRATAEKLVSEAPRRSPSAPAVEKRKTPEVATSQPGFLVQVGAFASQSSAQDKVEGLKRKGFDAWVSASRGSGTKNWRVRLGPLQDRAKAQALARRLEDAGQSTWVLANDGETGS